MPRSSRRRSPPRPLVDEEGSSDVCDEEAEVSWIAQEDATQRRAGQVSGDEVFGTSTSNASSRCGCGAPRG